MGRRRTALPFQAPATPGVRRGTTATEHRLQQVSGRHEEADGKNIGADRGDDMVDLEAGIGGIGCISTRHALAAKHELREEGHVEADEDQRESHRPQFSLYILPVIFGHQWCRPPIIAIRAEPIIT